MSGVTLTAPIDSSVLGARLLAGGARFSLWAPRATRVELALVAPDRSQKNHDMEMGKDGVWTVFAPGVIAGQQYGYRVHGDWSPQTGERFNPAKLLLDPYARAITGGVDYSGPILDHTAESDYLPDPMDSFASVPLSVVVADTPPPTSIARRRTMAESVIYEAHVKGLTHLHPAVPEHLRGTYGGIAYPAVVQHLVDAGVTALELMPVHHFVSEPFIIGRGLSNYWGYNTLGYFAPHAAYCSVGTRGEQVAEFKAMVSALHGAGIEVILDVVYNHTGEGGHEGPTLAWRGIDHGAYYRLTSDMHNDYDVTGCGNSVDTSQPGVLQMTMDSLRYWVTEMGVDGFRFDLATELIRNEKHYVAQDHPFKKLIAADPVLRDIKMIAEPWDMGPYGYQVGAWGPGWSEWNDRFRGHTRDFWRGAVHGVQELATRLSGSGELFQHSGRRPEASVNFVTAHDGFTMRDLVTYDVKHNNANGEANRDGSDDNRSWNCGVEGETEDPEIVELRHRQVRNMMATLLVSTGVPMITAGDEIGRTQLGNNNAYCQDSPISWVHWDTAESWADVLEVTRTFTRLRAEHPVLRPQDWRNGEFVVDPTGTELGRKNLAWFDGEDIEMDNEDWRDGTRRTLGMYVSDLHEGFLIWVHGGDQPEDVPLPGGPWALSYQVVAHTGLADELPTGTLPADTRLQLPARSVVMLQVELPDRQVPAAAPAGAASTPATPAESGPDKPGEETEGTGDPAGSEQSGAEALGAGV